LELNAGGNARERTRSLLRDESEVTGVRIDDRKRGE
jgi:hypothetical protein